MFPYIYEINAGFSEILQEEFQARALIQGSTEYFITSTFQFSYLSNG